jgi:hypothetical protein
MRVVGGLDVHRRRITFDYLDERSGQVRRGRVAPADRQMLRRWLETQVGDAPATCWARTTGAGSRRWKTPRPRGSRRWPPRCGCSMRSTPSCARCASRSPRSLPASPAAALQAGYGVGDITAVALWDELGETRRFSSSRKAVGHTGLDITVYSSDDKRPPGKLSRRGSPLLRWALFEAAKCAARPGVPEHAY